LVCGQSCCRRCELSSQRQSLNCKWCLEDQDRQRDMVDVCYFVGTFFPLGFCSEIGVKKDAGKISCKQSKNKVWAETPVLASHEYRILSNMKAIKACLFSFLAPHTFLQILGTTHFNILNTPTFKYKQSSWPG